MGEIHDVYQVIYKLQDRITTLEKMVSSLEAELVNTHSELVELRSDFEYEKEHPPFCKCTSCD